MDEKEYSQIIARLRVSDQQAFSEVYRLHWKGLHHYALQKTGSIDDATDLVQNLFTDLWDNRKKLPSISVDIKYYLKGILVHEIAGYFRKKGMSLKHEESFTRFLTTRQEQDTNKEAMLQQRLEKVLHEIDGLPEKMRNVFLLSCTRKYSIAEIATLLGISPQTVKNQVSGALHRIRKATGSDPRDANNLLLLIWIMIAYFVLTSFLPMRP